MIAALIFKDCQAFSNRQNRTQVEPILQTLMIERSRQEGFARLQETSKRLRDDSPIY
jgi:hypothetical protein